MLNEGEINKDDLKALADDAANARLYSSPPDAIVMRAIELGLGTRGELRRATGFGYDVIEKCLERHSGELRSEFVGEIEYFRSAPAPEIVEGICVDCGGPRSAQSWERCKKCHDAREAKKKIETMIAQGREPPQTTNNGDSAIHESVNPRNFEVFDASKENRCGCGRAYNHGGRCAFRWEQCAAKAGVPALRPQESDKNITQTITPKIVDRSLRAAELDYELITKMRVDGLSITVISMDLGFGRNYLNNRRVWDKKLNGALNDGLAQRAASGQKPPADFGQDVVKIETKVEQEIAQPKSAEIVEPDKKQDTLAVEKFTPQQFIDRFNSFDDVEIDQFFTLMNEKSAVDNVVWGVLPDEPKLDGQLVRVAYNVLVTILDDHMKIDEKQSVWTLIQYLKRKEKDQYA